jgi:hypothetical protein
MLPKNRNLLLKNRYDTGWTFAETHVGKLLPQGQAGLEVSSQRGSMIVARHEYVFSASHTARRARPAGA